MSRSNAVRQVALELDGYRCQITGRAGIQIGGDTVLNVHHVHPLGSGGGEEGDTVDNVITLAESLHMGDVHPGVSMPTVRILRWDRNDKENGLVVERREKGEWQPWPKEELWFYRRQLAQELEPIEARIQGLHLLDGTVAADLYRLWKDDAYTVLDPEARSFKAYSESRGWDTGRAMRLVSLYRRAQELEIEWPEGMTATDFRRELRNAGKIKTRAFYYAIFELRPISIEPDGPEKYKYQSNPCVVRVVRTDNPDALVESLDWGEVAARVGKWIGLQAKDGKLLDREGRSVAYKTLVDEAGKI